MSVVKSKIIMSGQEEILKEAQGPGRRISGRTLSSEGPASGRALRDTGRPVCWEWSSSVGRGGRIGQAGEVKRQSHRAQ